MKSVTDNSANGNSHHDGDYNAESSHLRKPSRAQWERLQRIAIEQIAGTPTIQPVGHLDGHGEMEGVA